MSTQKVILTLFFRPAIIITILILVSCSRQLSHKGVTLMERFEDSELAQEMTSFHCPRMNEFPDLELYMDQVLTILQSVLSPFADDSGEKFITSTMVNNYVKQKVVSPPQKKKYNRKHLVYLMVVCILKQVLSLSEICQLIQHQIDTYPIEEAYDFFCSQVEMTLKATFTDRNFCCQPSVKHQTPETLLVQSAALAFANKIYLQKYLQFKKAQIASKKE